MRSASLLVFFLSTATYLQAQNRTDSSSTLNEVVVRAYFAEQPLLRSPASVSILDSKQLNNHPDASLVPAMNTLPGIRMEERSPGSYRLSIRGSLLRSPFGIRNLKIYMDEFPVTDAGGNTYLNLLDAGSLSRIEVLKGPEASIFGANSGGVILISPFDRLNSNTSVSAGINGGSYGLFHEKVAFQQQWKNYMLNLNQAYQRSDGYRQNSALHRNYVNLAQQWNYSPSGQLRSVLLYSDLEYQTPGGLTAAQAELNPRLARPAAGKIPGAIQQQAGIFNKSVMAGLVNETRLAPGIRYVASAFGLHTDFKNPFITNFEVRNENSLGIRTYLEAGKNHTDLAWRWNIGMESQKTHSDISNYDNNGGTRAAKQSADKLNAGQDFIFSHLSLDVNRRLFIETAASLNFYNYTYQNRYPLAGTQKLKRFKPQLMPRLALSYQFTEDFAWRASASRGYSPPTIAEVRASDNIINTDLQPERGWNYETGFRFRDKNDRFWLDALVFHYRLQDAIVRRLNATDNEYFINAGGTRQIGFESQLISWLLKPGHTGLVNGIQLRNSYTLSNFTFRDYRNAAADYSGNKLTGVPRNVVVSSLDIQFPAGFYLFAQHNYTSKLPLNDANSIFAKSYTLVQLKAGRQVAGAGRAGVNIFAGVDNLLDAKYSLGNDLNAANGRYFNPSPGRNYYLGISAAWKKK